MFSDLKYALRQLIRSPGFTLFAVLTLALGIGANTAIFTVLNTVLLSTLPVKDPQQLVFLTDPNDHGVYFGSQAGVRTVLSYQEFQDLRRHNEVFSGILAVNSQLPWLNVTVEGASPSGAADHLPVSMVSGDYFSVLGVDAALGRTFGAEVDRARDGSPVAIISYQFWQGRLGGDPGVIGKRIRIGDTAYDVIGVAARGFSGETVGLSPSVWVPLTMQREILPSYDLLGPENNPLFKSMCWQVIGRLKPGISVSQAEASVNVVFRQRLMSQLGSGVPQNAYKDLLSQRLALVKGDHGASTLRKGYGEPLIILMVLVTLLLLLACANVANLLLARAAFRQKEIAVRVALGAKPSRIFRQLLTESILLSCLGGIAGLVFAQWGDSFLLRLVGQSLDVHPNARMLLFTLGASILVGIFFGTAPALQAARVDLNAILKGTGGNANRIRRVSLGKVLVSAQVALSLLLMIVAGLFVHSFRNLAAVDLGYDHDHILLFGVYPTNSGYKGAAIRQLYEKLVDRIRVLPGVRGVTFSESGLFGGTYHDDTVSIDGYAPPSSQNMSIDYDHVGPNYLSTIGIPILLGREIGPRDEGPGQRYAVINRTLAQTYFGETNPIGRRIRDETTLAHPDLVVIGVAADAKYNNIREKTPALLYVPFYNPWSGGMTDANFEVRVVGNPAALTAAMRVAVKQAAPNLPPLGIRTLNDNVNQTLRIDRLLTKISGLFSALATLLASLGIYGVISYAVARRTREIGIRSALGAQRGDILWLVMNESLLLVLIGTAIGVPVAIGAEKLIASLLFGLPPADPTVLAAAVGLMFLVAALAGYLPARRAAKVDPVVALRAE